MCLWVIFSVNQISFYLQLNVSQRFLFTVIFSLGDKIYYQVYFTKPRLQRLTHAHNSTCFLPLGNICFHEQYLLAVNSGAGVLMRYPGMIHLSQSDIMQSDGLVPLYCTRGKSPRSFFPLTPKGIKPWPLSAFGGLHFAEL